MPFSFSAHFGSSLTSHRLLQSTGTCRGHRRPPKHRHRPRMPSLLRHRTASPVSPTGPLLARHHLRAPLVLPDCTLPPDNHRRACGLRAVGAPGACTTPPCRRPFSPLDRAARARPMWLFSWPRMVGRCVARAVAPGQIEARYCAGVFIFFELIK
jgi:hypothetical protein